MRSRCSIPRRRLGVSNSPATILGRIFVTTIDPIACPVAQDTEKRRAQSVMVLGIIGKLWRAYQWNLQESQRRLRLNDGCVERAVLERVVGTGDGTRTRDIQLGKIDFDEPLNRSRSGFWSDKERETRLSPRMPQDHAPALAISPRKSRSRRR